LVGKGQVFELTSGLSACYVKASVHKGLPQTSAEMARPAGEVVDDLPHLLNDAQRSATWPLRGLYEIYIRTTTAYSTTLDR